MREKESWFIWSLHLILGLGLGGGLGFLAAGMLLRNGLADWEAIPEWCLGGAFLGGAVTSLRGNSLWYGRTVFSEDEPELKRGSRVCSMVIGAAGVMVLMHALAFHLLIFEDRLGMPGHHVSGLGITLGLGFTLFFLWLGIYAIREGTAFVIGRWDLGQPVDQEQSPLAFWISVGFYFFTAGMGVLHLIRDIFG